MNRSTVLTKFYQGLNWNAFFYAAYKTMATVISFVLFKCLSSKDFSTWANISSVIFLSRLWLDFGFRKSLARYCPEFAQDKAAQKRFIRYIIIFQIIVSIITIPIFVYGLGAITKILSLNAAAPIIWMSCAIFCLESLVSLLRLIFHAHFWIKEFNLINTAALMLEALANIGIIFTATSSENIIMGVFVTKMISGAITGILGFAMLPRLYNDKNYPGEQKIDFSKTMKAFIEHSGIMWLNNSLKTLSERNFLMPMFTHGIGHVYANFFKVANEGALLFYRIVLKTIGTTDTALLSHAATAADEQKFMPYAFQKLSSRIAALCFPLLGILFLIYYRGQSLFIDPVVFQAFLIMAIGYMIELIISPYERLLEIKREYRLLLFAYMPYIIIVYYLFFYSIISSIGLLRTLICIQGVRLVSSTITLLLARRKYHILYPLRLVLPIIIGCCVSVLLILCIIDLVPFPFSYIGLS